MIWTMGEMIVEIMRSHENTPLDTVGEFLGPYPSGAPAIFIDAVAKNGHKCGIIGGVGNDDFGKCLTQRLKNDGVDCTYVLKDDKVSTGCAFVTYFTDGSRKFIFHIGNTPAAKAKMPQTLPKADYFHIMGCSVMASEEFGNEIIKTMNSFKKNGSKISFDPNIRPELIGNSTLINEIIKSTNILLPGKEELLLISGESDIISAVAKMFENNELEIIVVKDGSRGSTAYTRTDKESMGVYKTNSVDATGAGDTFDATFICSLEDGLSLKDCLSRASAAAALNVAAFGPMEGKISPEAILEVMNREKEV